MVPANKNVPENAKHDIELVVIPCEEDEKVFPLSMDLNSPSNVPTRTMLLPNATIVVIVSLLNRLFVFSHVIPWSIDLNNPPASVPAK